MRFDVVRLDDLRSARVNQPAKFVDDPRVVPIPLDQDLDRNPVGNRLRIESVGLWYVAEAPANQQEPDTDLDATDAKPSHARILERIASDAGQPGSLQNREHLETGDCLQRCGEPGRGMHAAQGCNEAARKGIRPCQRFNPLFGIVPSLS